MVAKIKQKSLIGALNYNENKVKQQKALLIEASKYPKDTARLSFQDKLFRLTDLAGMNQRAKTNAIHISLNFASGEQLPDETLKDIVKDYMQGIGFATQPYLVYRHEDAGHPHVHIVTTNIQRDGQRINLHNLGQNESETCRKAIEVKYKLIKAEEQAPQKPELKSQPEVANYGKAETKRMITNTVNHVISAYKFTSIPELNAVLGQFHIQADRGSKDSRMHLRGGLIYWILKDGEKIGVPIKASAIYGKPTLKALEAKFKLNEVLRKPLRQKLIDRIDKVLNHPQTPDSFIRELAKLEITAILRRNDEGRLYGVTFIDQQNKAVFNGSDLGKAYSANLLSTQLTVPIPNITSNRSTATEIEPTNASNSDLLNILFAPEREDLAALSKFKKKKRKGLNL